MKTITSLTAGLVLGLSAIALTPAPSVAGVIISANDTVVQAGNDSSGDTSNSFTGTTIPTSQTLSISYAGNSSAIGINYSTGGGSTTLSGTVTQSRSGALGSIASGFQGQIEFTVTAPSTYAFSGNYNVTDVTTAGYVWLYAELYDLTTSTSLLFQHSVSQSTSNESFTLGTAAGDVLNQLTGSLTGNLVVGDTYGWTWDLYTQALNGIDGGASATGNMTLTVQAPQVTQVPEPGTLALFASFGLAGLDMLRRKKAA